VELPETDSWLPFETELNIWRKTRFDRMLARRDPLPALTAAVRARQGTERAPGLADIRALLIEAVAAVEAAQPPDVSSDNKGRISNPAVIREVFGLTGRSKNASTGTRQQLAGEVAGPGNSAHSIRKHNATYVEQLAAWVRVLLQPSATPPAISGPLGPITRRNDLAWLHTTYRALLKGGGGIFILWGLPGIGKTTLARLFANEIGPPQLTGLIRIGGRGLYDEDIRHILQMEGHDTNSWSDDHCQAMFRTAAQRFTKIRFLVLDDVRSENDVSSLIPYGVAVPVLITARERPWFIQSSSTSHPTSRQLLPFTAEQSEFFLRNQVSRLDASTASYLAKTLGGHAETMHYVVRYLAMDGAISPDDLSEELDRSTRTIDDLTEVLGIPNSLRAILNQLYRQIADDAVTVAVLTTIIWTNISGEQPRELVREVTSELLHRLTDLEFQASLRRLERLGILAGTDSSLVLTRLTCQMFRDLLINSRESVLTAYERVIATPPEQERRTTLLYILRQEYEFLQPLRTALAERLGNTQTPLPALVALDDSNWALFTTNPAGPRQIEIYRTTRETLLYLPPGATQWEGVADEATDQIVQLISRVYPTIEAGWRQFDEQNRHTYERGI
jgi:ATPase family associated with various cellular activities (AAA)